MLAWLAAGAPSPPGIPPEPCGPIHHSAEQGPSPMAPTYPLLFFRSPLARQDPQLAGMAPVSQHKAHSLAPRKLYRHERDKN